MKKFLASLVVVIALVALAKFGGRYIGVRSALDSIQREAQQQHMPNGFYGVMWLDSTEELRSKRPRVVPDSDGVLAEQETFLDRQAKVSYYVKTGNVLIFAVHFAVAASIDEFKKTNQVLDHDYGPLSAAENESDEYGQKYCSHRKSGRFQIDHCIRTQGQSRFESIVFFRSKG